MKSPRTPSVQSEVPEAFKVMLSRLFGSQSVDARKQTLTDAEWKRILHRIVNELEKYIFQNIDTDELHMYMIWSTLLAAHEALRLSDFWPAYTEATLRMIFLLIGDSPNHKRRKGGRRSDHHYDLKLCRTVRYTQDQDQKLRTLLATGRLGLPKLENDPEVALREFREEFGSRASYKQFFKWYRQKYGKDYALVF